MCSEQLAHWTVDSLAIQYGHFYGALEVWLFIFCFMCAVHTSNEIACVYLCWQLVSLFSQSAALQTSATLATAQAVRSLLHTLEQYTDDLEDSNADETVPVH